VIRGQAVLAVVTARGGSKGLPGKNLRPLAGRPLISWTIDAALGARSIDRTLVSSDSEEILKTARAGGAEAPFARPAELSGDDAKQEDAVLHAMDFVEREGGRYDYVMMLAPTNPLRDAEEIDAVAEFLAAHERAKSAMTVVPSRESPLHANVLPPDLSLAGFVDEKLKLKNRQELPRYHRICGSVCIAEWGHFRREGSFLTPDAYAYVTTPRKGVDIDDIIDFKLAEIYIDEPELN
jgi:CMP-N,N'-diacetyllegionaminic acid synthase